MEFDVDFAATLATKKDLELLSQKPYQARIPIGRDGQTDSNGNLALRVYDVQDGKTFFLYKLIVVVAGVNPGSFASLGTNPGIGIYHGQSGGLGAIADFGPIAGAVFGLPCTFEYNSHTAPEFRAPDNMMVQIFNGPVSSNIAVLGWGELYEYQNVRNY